MRGKNIKTAMRNFLLLAMIVLVIGTPGLQNPQASEVGYRRTNERLVVGFDDERNIEKIAISRVQPSYPPNAQKYKIEGVVTVQVNVGSDGKVTKAEFIRGNNLFRSVSLDAAKRWEFKLPGENSLEGTIRFTFKLNS
jgi:TonB family protein